MVILEFEQLFVEINGLVVQSLVETAMASVYVFSAARLRMV